jgi:uncharacterized membrane protein YccF (DUF307 family)
VKILGNIIWLLFAGIWLFIGYLFAAILNAIFIITIPFAIQSLKLAMFVIWPFGRTAVDRPGASAFGSGCGNILWFILGGWYLVLVHILTGLLLCLPIITIPFALQNFKLAGLALAPFGKEIVSNAEAQKRRAYYQGGATGGWPGAPALPPQSPRTDITF